MTTPGASASVPSHQVKEYQIPPRTLVLYSVAYFESLRMTLLTTLAAPVANLGNHDNPSFVGEKYREESSYVDQD